MLHKYHWLSAFAVFVHVVGFDRPPITTRCLIDFAGQGVGGRMFGTHRRLKVEFHSSNLMPVGGIRLAAIGAVAVAAVAGCSSHSSTPATPTATSTPTSTTPASSTTSAPPTSAAPRVRE